jgi:hypothetical protein
VIPNWIERFSVGRQRRRNFFCAMGCLLVLLAADERNQMHASQTNRRYAAMTDMSANPYADATHVVRQGIQIQATLGTRSAVEFLKQHDVHGAVIHRVLMGDRVRLDDQMVPQDQVAIDDPRM